MIFHASIRLLLMTLKAGSVFADHVQNLQFDATVIHTLAAFLGQYSRRTPHDAGAVSEMVTAFKSNDSYLYNNSSLFMWPTIVD